MATFQDSAPKAPNATAAGPPFRLVALLALALGSFAIGCTEFVAVGLLPQIATGLGVAEGVVGQLVTLNALAVAVAAPTLGAFMARYPCRPVLVADLAVFAAAHVMAALAPNFAVLLLSRVLTGASFGLYLAVAFAAAARLASESQRARALATVQGGITTATALGVPLGMLLGEAFGASGGWRVPFLAIALLSVLALAAVATTLPALAPEGAVSFRSRISVLGRGRVAVGIAAIAVFWAGSFCAFTYIVPLLTQQTGLAGMQVTGVLLLAGAMSVAGNVAGGRGADRALSRTLLLTAAVTLIGLVALFLVSSWSIAAIAMVGLWQLAAWSFVPAAQATIYELGDDEGEAAVSFSVAAFNVGIVAGAGLGGLALEGSGLDAVGLVAATLAAVALVVTAFVVRLRRPRASATA